MKDYIQENFGVTARKGQNETIADVIEGFESGYDNIIVDAPTGSGKLIAHETPVLTTKGWKTHGELKVGDYVFGIDGKPKKILATSEEINCNMKITFRRKNGNNISDFSFYTHENHVWVLQKGKTSSLIKQFTTKELINEKLRNRDKDSKTQERMRFWLPIITPLKMDKKKLLIDPYWFALWLGDGTKNKMCITQLESDVNEWIDSIPYKRTSICNIGGSAKTHYFGGQGLIQNLKKLNVYNNKHIPEIYKQASIEQKLELIAGLIDSDGNRKDKTRYAFDNNNLQLVKDMREILISLGFVVSKIITQKNPPRSINGSENLSYFKDTYRIVFNPRLKIPCRLKRHKVEKTKKPRRLGLHSVEYVNTDKKGKCIEVEDGIYLIGRELIPTHNSYISVALARYYNDSYIYTPQKLLQDQYGREFPEVPILKGRSNYECQLSKRLKTDRYERNCANGLCLSRKINYYKKDWNSKLNKFNDRLVLETIKCPGGRFRNDEGYLECHKTKNAYRDEFGTDNIGGFACNYLEQKSKAVQAPITILNYDYGLAELNFAKELQTRTIGLHDESHSLDSKIMNFIELKLPLKRLQGIFNNQDNSIDKRLEELGTAYQSLQDQYDNNEVEIEKQLALKTLDGDIKADNLMTINTKLDELIKKITRTHEHIKEEPENWIIKLEDNEIIFKPILVHKYAQEYLLKYTKKNVFLSGTIISPSKFSEWLGLEKVGLSNLIGHFPKETRPIEIIDGVGSMSKRNIDESMKKGIPVIKKILELHKNDKGLIHSNSFKITKLIRENIHNDRLIFHDGTENQYDLIEKFTKSDKPLVLVSPSVKEGIDLKDDLGRFQIIAKIPYKYLGDAQVMARKNLDDKHYDHKAPIDYHWYTLETVKDLVQSLGRVVRHKNDFAVSYIIDSDINRLLGPKSSIPLYTQEAIRRNGKFENEIEYKLTNKPMRLRKTNKIQIINSIKQGTNTLEKMFKTSTHQDLETYNNLRVTIKDLLADEYIEEVK